MYKPKLEKEIRCPLEYGIDIFGGKWKARIICILSEKGLLRYNEVRRELTDITDAVLSATLKELIANDIIIRMQYNEIPPRVEYTLTDKGKTVIPILQSICRWSGAYHKSDNENIFTQCQKCDYNYHDK
jgi:DNA-binding HxlR family transcriptional regulator